MMPIVPPRVFRAGHKGLTLLFCALFSLGILANNAAFATDVGEAEHIRLSADISQLAGRQVWTGVEKKFQELEKLGVELTYDDLMHGAYAARALGSVQNAYDRLRRAAKLDGTREVIDWLSSIDANYGPVELICIPAREGELLREELPFEPDQRVAVEAAIGAVRKDGGFVGLLPKGEYSFSGHTFKVEPGISVRIDASPRLKKTSGILVTVTPLGTEPVVVPAPQ